MTWRGTVLICILIQGRISNFLYGSCSLSATFCEIYLTLCLSERSVKYSLNKQDLDANNCIDLRKKHNLPDQGICCFEKKV